MGKALCEELVRGGETEAVLSVPARLGSELGLTAFASLDEWTAENFAGAKALVFVGATGIAVRAVAPYLRDKFTDPAVVAVDEKGSFAVPLVSGHVGGANSLAREIAAICGGTAIISTATDVRELFAVDDWAARRGLAIDGRAAAKAISAVLLEGGTVGFYSEYPVRGAVPAGLTNLTVTKGGGALGFSVTHRSGIAPFEQTLRLIPKVLSLGIGCRRGAETVAIAGAVSEVLAEYGLDGRAVRAVHSIDLKANETGLIEFCGELGVPFTCYSAAELADTKGEFTASERVLRVTGVDNVCERAALRGSDRGEIIVRKTIRNSVTVSVALDNYELEFERVIR